MFRRGDEPDRSINPKFGHKLDFIEEMKSLAADAGDGVSSLLLGDLNIAPHEHDVWSHKQLLNVVSHTPVRDRGLIDVMQAGRGPISCGYTGGARKALYLVELPLAGLGGLPIAAAG